MEVCYWQMLMCLYPVLLSSAVELCCRQLYINEQEKKLRAVHTDALKHLCREVSNVISVINLLSM